MGGKNKRTKRGYGSNKTDTTKRTIWARAERKGKLDENVAKRARAQEEVNTEEPSSSPNTGEEDTLVQTQDKQ